MNMSGIEFKESVQKFIDDTAAKQVEHPIDGGIYVDN